jgi:hypothetical protein
LHVGPVVAVVIVVEEIDVVVVVVLVAGATVQSKSAVYTPYSSGYRPLDFKSVFSAK